MKYQITCAHCGTRFLVDAKGGQTVECTCPGCEGKMRVNIPKSGKDDDKDADTAVDQQGYIPSPDDNDNDGGNGGSNHHRGLALGCLLFIVVAAAAVIAFLALNKTTKKPIEDPYEYIEPDTATIDTVEVDTEEQVVDTVEAPKEEPKIEAEPADSTEEEPVEGATDENGNALEGQSAEPQASHSTRDDALKEAEPTEKKTEKKAEKKAEKSHEPSAAPKDADRTKTEKK